MSNLLSLQELHNFHFTFNKRVSAFNVAIGGLILAAYPLARILPPQLAWENNVIESLQALLLLLIALLCFSVPTEFLRRQSRALGCFFLLLLGRELSWGRVFFPTGVIDELGPNFISMSNIPGHQFIHAAIFLALCFILRAIVKSFNWTALAHVPIPVVTFIILLVATAGQLCAERHLFAGLTLPQNQTLEELLELCIYMELFQLSLYYGLMRISMHNCHHKLAHTLH
jgi:hypothetical protein